MVAMAICCWAFMSFYLRAKNKRRADGKEDFKMNGRTEEELKEMGDASPHYVYTY